MSISYTWQKLHEAVVGLAAIEAPINERVEFAFSRLSHIPPGDCAPELNEKWEALYADYAALPTSGEERLRGLKQLAKDIVSAYDEACRHTTW